ILVQITSLRFTLLYSKPRRFGNHSSVTVSSKAALWSMRDRFPANNPDRNFSISSIPTMPPDPEASAHDKQTGLGVGISLDIKQLSKSIAIGLLSDIYVTLSRPISTISVTLSRYLREGGACVPLHLTVRF